MDGVTLFRAAGVCDAAGVDASPGAVAVRAGVVLASGDEAEVRRVAGRADREVDLRDCLLLPAMVNAHAHLDLSLSERRAFGGDFVAWLESVMQSRAEGDVCAAVDAGLKMSREAGVGWVGDIAGSTQAARARIEAGARGLPGVSWLERFGRGERAEQSGMEAASWIELHKREAAVVGVRLGVQPHAPYSCAASLFALAGAIGGASTHLAETLEEDLFVRQASGPFAELLRRMGRWHESISATGKSPVEWFCEVAKSSGWVVAHGNYVSDDDIAKLASARASVAYCPIASEYFRHPIGDAPAHRYREMLDAGVNVCLGTDSVICQPRDEPQPMSIWAQARRLYARDRCSPKLLLAMATTRGLRALGLDERDATFSPGVAARLVAIPVEAGNGPLLAQALQSRANVRSIALGFM